MTLSTFCDIVWAEIWDDCPALGDQAQYREVMVRLIIDGDDPATITWTDHAGKTRRLTEPQPGRVRGRPSIEALDKLRELHGRLNPRSGDGDGLASSGDG